MKSCKHIFKRDNKYYLVDGNSLYFYCLDSKFNEQLDRYSQKQLDELAQNIVTKDEEPTKVVDSDKNCRRLILNISDFCNLRCKYCYAEEGKYKRDKTSKMNLDTIRKSIETVLEICPLGIEYIQFFGGEPCTNKELLMTCIPCINDICKSHNLDIPKYTIVTNGTLIDDDLLELFNKYFYSVTVSIDGYKNLNDINRVFSGTSNKSVYDIVDANIQRMNKDRKYYLCIECTITKEHILEFKRTGTIKTIEYLNNSGVNFFEMSPVFDMNGCNLGLENVDINDVRKYFEIWTKKCFENKTKESLGLCTIGSILKIFKNRRYVGNTCGASRNDLAIDTKGDIYPCFMFIGEDKYKLGNINNFNIDKYRDIRKSIISEFDEANNCDICENCWANKLCSNSYGHCIGSRYLVNKNVYKPVEIGCFISKVILETVLTQSVELLVEV